MKKSILNVTLTVLSAIFSLNLVVAQVKEGSINYSITVDGLPPEQAAFAQGMEMKMTFKNGKTRLDIISAFVNSSVVTDVKGNSTSISEMMGQKTFFKTNTENDKKAKAQIDPKITYIDEKKTIAGYECKKALIEVKDEKGNLNSSTVWYTEKIPYVSSGGKRDGQFKGLKGSPLEFSQAQGQMKSTMTATNITTASIPDSTFELSTEGYTEMNPADMGKGMGGQ